MTPHPLMIGGSLRRRIERQKRQRRIARFIFRVLRFDEVEPIGIGEYRVAAGYVTLSNDQDVVIREARKVLANSTNGQYGLVELRAAVREFDAMYPERRR